MRILGLDPGAKRAGWSVIESEGSGKPTQIKYLGSGILGRQPEGNYQDFRVFLIEFWVDEAIKLLHSYNPDIVVSEIVPPVGGSIPAIINMQLSLTVVTVIQTVAHKLGYGFTQLGATTVKKQIGGVGKASKVQVRNGVLKLFPELEHRRKEWTGNGAVWDELDALAVSSTYLLTKGMNG